MNARCAQQRRSHHLEQPQHDRDRCGACSKSHLVIAHLDLGRLGTTSTGHRPEQTLHLDVNAAILGVDSAQGWRVLPSVAMHTFDKCEKLRRSQPCALTLDTCRNTDELHTSTSFRSSPHTFQRLTFSDTAMPRPPSDLSERKARLHTSAVLYTWRISTHTWTPFSPHASRTSVLAHTDTFTLQGVELLRQFSIAEARQVPTHMARFVSLAWER